MRTIEQSIDVLRDWKRISAKPKDNGLSRSELFKSHIHLKLKSLRLSGQGEVSLLGYRVKYLDIINLFHLYREIFIGGVYDFKLESNAPRIIDCGSNIGLSILYFKKVYPMAQIIGFEPHPVIYKTLQHNINVNNLNNVVIHQKAMSEEQGDLDFYLDEDDLGALNMGLVGRPGQSEKITVVADTLSNYITTDIDLLKLDIEGAEEGVLRQLYESGALNKVKNIVCEYHHHIENGIDRLSHTLRILEDAGFGYQLTVHSDIPFSDYRYQDVMIYAYKKLK